MARKRNGFAPLSVRELAQLSGLSKSTVSELSLKKTWDGVSIDVVVRFSEACGVDLMRPRDAREYLRHSKKVHIENATPKQKRFFLRLFTARG